MKKNFKRKLPNRFSRFFIERLGSGLGGLAISLIVLVGIAYSYTTWSTGTDPQAAPGDGNIDFSVGGAWQLSGSDLVFETGNVGVGTAAPAKKLHVVGSNHFVTFENTDTTANTYAQMLLKAGSATSYLWTANQNSTLWGGPNSLNIYAGSGGAMTLWTNATEKMRITTEGNVGIGTTAPGYRLQVDSNTSNWGVLFRNLTGINNYVYMNHGTNGVHIRNDSATAGNFLLDVYPSNAKRFQVMGDGNVIANNNITAVGFLYSSDRKLKKNISPIEEALQKILALEGVSFEWREGGVGIGLIAQDVEKVFPELVQTNPATGLKSVEYGNLVAPLIEAVKAQQKEIDFLKSEFANLN